VVGTIDTIDTVSIGATDTGTGGRSALLRRGLARLSSGAPPPLRDRLARFADVLIPDGCAFKLAAALSGLSQGTGTPAELKLHTVYSVRANGPVAVTPSAGICNWRRARWPPPWSPPGRWSTS
jgi:hypothetical protein